MRLDENKEKAMRHLLQYEQFEGNQWTASLSCQTWRNILHGHPWSLSWYGNLPRSLPIYSAELLSFLSRGGNAKFTNELKLAEDTKEKAIAETPVLRGDPAQPIYSYSAVNDPVVELASRFPELAVLESFKVVERALTGLMTNAPTKLTNSNVSQFVAKLYKEEMIGPTHFTWFQELRSLRNTAAHASPKSVTPAEALLYREQCLTFANFIDGLRDKIIWKPES